MELMPPGSSGLRLKRVSVAQHMLLAEATLTENMIRGRSEQQRRKYSEP